MSESDEGSKSVQSSESGIEGTVSVQSGELQDAEGPSTDSISTQEIEKRDDVHPPEVLDGRRIVELLLVSKRLHQGCCACSTELHLIDCKKDVKYGLASVLHVVCRQCKSLNTVQTSKSHAPQNGKGSRVYDINTKAALGGYWIECEKYGR